MTPLPLLTTTPVQFSLYHVKERRATAKLKLPPRGFLSLEVFNTIIGELCVCESEAPYVETSLRLLSIQSALSGGFPLRGEQA